MTTALNVSSLMDESDLDLDEISNFKDRVKNISFGSHDLAKSINLKVSTDEQEILEYRKLIAKYSKNPIDTSYLNFKDLKKKMSKEKRK